MISMWFKNKKMTMLERQVDELKVQVAVLNLVVAGVAKTYLINPDIIATNCVDPDKVAEFYKDIMDSLRRQLNVE